MFKPTYLYIKTHNKTGLKYFGKTTENDPNRYKGSGKYWTRHIKKHGYDVSTQILGLFTDKTECEKVARHFSQENNIVESKEWANFKVENGLDGGFGHVNDSSESHRKRAAKAGKICHERHPELALENSKTWNTKESRERATKTKLERYGSDYFSKIASLPKSEDHKRKISETLKRKSLEVTNIPEA